jgi:acyl dehydratase
MTCNSNANNLWWSEVSEGDALPCIEVRASATAIVGGAIASRDYAPLHHDVAYATKEAGHRDIFFNSPTLAGLFERYLCDWAGPLGRLGRMRVKMKTPVYPGDQFTLMGRVKRRFTDETDCGWIELELQMQVSGKTVSECTASYALALTDSDHPWQRRATQWQP